MKPKRRPSKFTGSPPWSPEHDRLQAQLHELYTPDQAARGEWIPAAVSAQTRATLPTLPA